MSGVIVVLNKYPSLKIGDKTLKPEEEEWTRASVTALNKSITDDIQLRADLESQLATVNNRLQDNARTGNEVVTRARSLIRGQFGPDSDEYEKVGGTRASERKPSAKRTPKKPT